jgi:hypothetical protein
VILFDHAGVVTMRLSLTLCFGLLATLPPLTANAFCGFYVSRADGSLYNRSSTVVYTRVNETSVITMSSDYRGPAAEFAMIVPTPTILDKSQVQTVPAATVAHLDRYTAPRLVEYFDYDPCPGEGGPVVVVDEGEPVVVANPSTRKERREGARSLGVTIEREFAVGSYDIQMLSARQSDGLAEFLRGEGYKLPDGAEDALQGYITMGMKFFVAKVNLQRHSADAAQDLEPLQMTFRSPDFMLPIQLGKVNGDGPQDLIVLALTRQGRVNLTNYTTKEIPTDQNVPIFVKEVFPQFFRAMVNKLAPKSGAFLEYAWDMGWCDPCSDDPLTFAEFQQLGVVWVRKADASVPNVFVTRLHIRYDAKTFYEDLKFVVTDNRDNFQGRYVLNHPFDGEITCDAGDYIAEVRKRTDDEAKTVRGLTGWSMDNIRSNIAKTIPKVYR